MKGTSAQGAIPVISSLSGVLEITHDAFLVCPRFPPFQKSGGSAPVMHPHSGVPVFATGIKCVYAIS